MKRRKLCAFADVCEGRPLHTLSMNILVFRYFTDNFIANNCLEKHIYKIKVEFMLIEDKY